MRLRRDHVIRLGRLLNMRYRPAELASEIGCHPDTVYRSYIPAGCPHERDGRGHIWIVGTEFAEWAQNLASQDRVKLAAGEAFCFKCSKAVRMAGPVTIKRTNRYLEMASARCPECGTVVNRARARTDRTGSTRK
jgi:hypothetical protein